MKLLIAYRGDISNPRCWSGTPFNLKRQFESMPDVSLSSMHWEINKNILRVYHRMLRKRVCIYGTARDPLLTAFFERRLSNRVKIIDTPPDFVLFMSDYLMTDEVGALSPCGAYVDAFLKKQIGYSDDRRIGKRRFLDWYEKKSRESLHRMAVVFTQNEWTRQCLVNEYGLSPAKVHNVGFGINTELYTGEKDYDNELLLIVLRKGTEKYKGLNLLLDAFRILKRRRPKAKLAVVGTELEDRPEGVTYHFNQPRSVTVELFHRAALYAMPALHEPNGITYLEALANKTPIVGLNRFAVPEFCNDGQWGFMAENEDPEELAAVLVNALEDRDRLQMMGERGQQFVAGRYRWEIVAQKMVDLIMRNV